MIIFRSCFKPYYLVAGKFHVDSCTCREHIARHASWYSIPLASDSTHIMEMKKLIAVIAGASSRDTVFCVRSFATVRNGMPNAYIPGRSALFTVLSGVVSRPIISCTGYGHPKKCCKLGVEFFSVKSRWGSRTISHFTSRLVQLIDLNKGALRIRAGVYVNRWKYESIYHVAFLICFSTCLHRVLFISITCFRSEYFAFFCGISFAIEFTNCPSRNDGVSFEVVTSLLG